MGLHHNPGVLCSQTPLSLADLFRIFIGLELASVIEGRPSGYWQRRYTIEGGMGCSPASQHEAAAHWAWTVHRELSILLLGLGFCMRVLAKLRVFLLNPPLHYLVFCKLQF